MRTMAYAMGNWLSRPDREIAEVLLQFYRRYAIKFQSRSAFDRLGWGKVPVPRFEAIYRVVAKKGLVRHTAPLIWDLREALLRDEALYLTCILMWRKLQKYNVEYIGSIETAGIPLLSGILLVNRLCGARALSAFYVRKSRKEDGLRRIAEGARVPKGTAVVVVDDILNRGVTKRRILNYCRDNELRIKALLVAVDTQSGGARLVRNCPIETIFRQQDILSKGSSTKHGQLPRRIGAPARAAPRALGSPGVKSVSDWTQRTPDAIELVRMARDAVCYAAISRQAVSPTLGDDDRGSSGYRPFLGRYLTDRGPAFVRISKREFKNGIWVNRLRGCQCVGLLSSHPGTYAEMTIASAIAAATRARKVIPGKARFHKPVWPEELGSLSVFVYIVEELIPTTATDADALANEGHNINDFGLVGTSVDGGFRGAICGDLDGVTSIEDQIRAVCFKAQNRTSIMPHRRSDMRFVRMRGRWLQDPQRPKPEFF